MKNVKKFERGAVSLFVVIVSALLITTITVAFIRIMIQDQEQARANDLSKSALDSSYAGVEDAKRLLVQYRKQCPDGPSTSPQCQTWADLMDGSNCDTLQRAEIVGTTLDREVLLKQSEGDEQLQQAYTCVKVTLDTPDYIGMLTPHTSRMIPLKGVGTFDRIEIEWYSQSDLQSVQSGGGSTTIDLPLAPELPKWNDDEWPKNRPALMRLQMIQFGESFGLSDFNQNDGANTNNSTLFLMPSAIDGTGGSLSFSDNVRQSQGGKSQPVLIECDSNFSATSTNGLYACKASITMPNPIGATNGDNRTAYLRVSEIYNPNTTFKLSLWSGANNVLFSAVQPIVDSTGRANDLFRRISARVDLGGSSIPQVEAAVDITGSLCKTFLVTDKIEDYTPGDCQD